MLEPLLAAWRARRVLLIGGADRTTRFMEALLDGLNARPARLPASADSETLCRAMQSGRIGAVIVPCAHNLAPGEGLLAQLRTLMILLGEAREAGVPLVILLSDESVYRTDTAPFPVREDAAIGGGNAQGLIQSVLQLCAEGVSRGLLGDAVSTLIIRHMPCLGCGHSAAAQYSAWCRQLLREEIVDVAHPGAQGVFLHPADVCLGALSLGARYLCGDRTCTGAFNLGVPPQNLMANRSAALRLLRDHGGRRPIRESEPPYARMPPLLDGAKARLLCGAQAHIPADEALAMLLGLERAALSGFGAEQAQLLAQAHTALERLLPG